MGQTVFALPFCRLFANMVRWRLVWAVLSLYLYDWHAQRLSVVLHNKGRPRVRGSGHGFGCWYVDSATMVFCCCVQLFCIAIPG